MLRALRRRLAAWYVAILGVVLAAYGAGTFVLACHVLARGADQENGHLLAPVEAAFARGGSLEAATEALDGIELAEGEHVALLDADGRVLRTRGVALPELPLTVGAKTEHGVAAQVRTLPLERDGVVAGYARAAHSLTVANRALAGLGLSLLVVVPVALVAAWIGGNWLAAQAVRPVEAAWERERQFTRDASHELRTPLAVMQAHADLATDLVGDDPALREKLAVLRDTARKMSRLVGDLLTLSREDAGVPGREVEFAFDELLEDELGALAPLAAARGVTVDAGALPEGRLVRGDPGRLGQAVRNVLDNALRYAGPGGRVDVRLREADGGLVLEVANTGAPIPAEDRDRVFERFHRAENGRAANPEGGGLGLPIGRAIARAHGGDLALASAPGEPTVFALRLPNSRFVHTPSV